MLVKKYSIVKITGPLHLVLVCVQGGDRSGFTSSYMKNKSCQVIKK